MPSKTNDTAAVEAAPVPETAHQPYCLCGTHGSYKMIAGLAIGFFLLITAFASGVFAGKITSRFGGGYNHRGMMGGYGQSYHGNDCGKGGYGRGMMREYQGSSGYGRGMMRGYHGYGYDRGTTTVPELPDDTNPSTPAPVTPAR